MAGNNLEKTDEIAASLIGIYRKLGEFAVLVRTTPDKQTVRVICPQMDVTYTSEFLHLCADTLFNGPASIKESQH